MLYDFDSEYNKHLSTLSYEELLRIAQNKVEDFCTRYGLVLIMCEYEINNPNELFVEIANWEYFNEKFFEDIGYKLHEIIERFEPLLKIAQEREV
jgi:hypothetical protein